MSNNLNNWELAGLIATIVIVLSIPAYLLKVELLKRPVIETPAEFVGGKKCKKCHEKAYKAWTDSHHDKAMDVANEKTVLGDFNDAVFEHKGITTRFYRKGETFFVNTQGPDGEMGDFEIEYVFGVYPLQQYLVPFPGGRLQCLTIAWDSRDKKWFALPNHVSDPDDWLHWTKNAQNWNGMCAECHSTNLKKGYDHKADTYTTTWSEIDVGCEACHGPGSLHVKWADRPAMARLPSDDLELVVTTGDLDPGEQLRICAPCHSRRSTLGDFSHEGKDLMDYVIPQLLNEGLYYPDGQILEEVYVHGSFVQSKMYRSGVRCSDCHDIHSLKRIKKGNDLCLQCHRADTYNTKDHHFHKKTHKGKPSDGWLCERCHMPGRYYMGNDYRLDHSIRIPRPDLSVKYNTPNSCNVSTCHDDKSVQWSVKHYTKWYGQKRKPHYGTVIAEGRERKPEAREQLLKLSEDRLFPPIVRATALSLVRSYPGEQSIHAFEQALRDDEPLIRHTAARELNQINTDRQIKLTVSLLYDPVKAVRIQAALNLSGSPREQLTDDQKRVFEEALLEFQRSMEHSADFPHARHNLGIMYANLGKNEPAAEHYKKSIEIDEQFYPAKVNLAMLYNRMGKNSEAEALLRDVLGSHPELYEVVYSLGLLLVEEKRFDEAEAFLKKAADGMPYYGRVHYNLGLLLQYMNRFPEAEVELLTALDIEPDNLDFLYALADHNIKRGRLLEARWLAERMIATHPENALGREILNFIETMEKSR